MPRIGTKRSCYWSELRPPHRAQARESTHTTSIPATGELNQIGLAVEADDPTFLALSPDEQILYSVNEINQFEGKNGGSVSSFTLDKKKATLTPVNKVFSMGGGPTHIAVDHTGRCVFAANYVGAASFHTR